MQWYSGSFKCDLSVQILFWGHCILCRNKRHKTKQKLFGWYICEKIVSKHYNSVITREINIAMLARQYFQKKSCNVLFYSNTTVLIIKKKNIKNNNDRKHIASLTSHSPLYDHLFEGKYWDLLFLYWILESATSSHKHPLPLLRVSLCVKYKTRLFTEMFECVCVCL